MSDQPTLPLNELAEFVNGDRSNNYPSGDDFVVVGIPFISATEIQRGRLNLRDVKRITPEAFQRLRSGKTREGDVLFCLRGSLGKTGRVLGVEAAAIASSLVIVRARAGVDARFLNYVLKSPVIQGVMGALDNGSAQPNLSVRELGNIRVPSHGRAEQRAIAHILGTLDDKIELNREMNETLEAMARALFNSWFVEFDPVRVKLEGRDASVPTAIAKHFASKVVESELGEVPIGWEIGCLGDAVQIRRDQENPLEFPDAQFLHFSIPAFDDGQRAVHELGAAIKSAKSRVSSGEVLLSKLNPEIERVWLVDVAPDDRAVCSTEFLVLQPRPPFTRAYIYCAARSPDLRRQIEGLVTGTSRSHQRAHVDSILKLKVVLPPAPLVEAFDAIAAALLERTLASRREADTLATLRDTLLPKLISGELRVKDAERFLEAAPV